MWLLLVFALLAMNLAMTSLQISFTLSSVSVRCPFSTSFLIVSYLVIWLEDIFFLLSDVWVWPPNLGFTFLCTLLLSSVIFNSLFWNLTLINITENQKVSLFPIFFQKFWKFFCHIRSYSHFGFSPSQVVWDFPEFFFTKLSPLSKAKKLPLPPPITEVGGVYGDISPTMFSVKQSISWNNFVWAILAYAPCVKIAQMINYTTGA